MIRLWKKKTLTCHQIQFVQHINLVTNPNATRFLTLFFHQWFSFQVIKETCLFTESTTQKAVRIDTSLNLQICSFWKVTQHPYNIISFRSICRNEVILLFCIFEYWWLQDAIIWSIVNSKYKQLNNKRTQQINIRTWHKQR